MRCGDCGHNMHFHVNSKNPDIHFFACSNSKVDKRGTCTPKRHYVRADAIEQIVKMDLQVSLLRSQQKQLVKIDGASETYELFNIHSEEQYRLLTEIKRAFSGAAIGTQQDDPVFRISDKRTVWAHEGFFEVLNDRGESIGHFSFESFRNSPRRTFERIKEKI